MFGKKQICPRCGNKSSKKYSFCPFCGNSFKSEEEFFEPSFKMGFPFNTIFKQLEKQIEKQFKEIDKEFPSFAEEEKPKRMSEGISISISSAGGQPVIRVRNLGDNQNVQRAQIQNPAQRSQPAKEAIQKPRLTEEQAEKFSKLPKQEPLANVRRMSDKIIYEIDMPGVEEKNIIITRLQNSIEIKAFAKDRAFFKLIPISLPIMKSELKDGKLVLELKPAQ